MTTWNRTSTALLKRNARFLMASLVLLLPLTVHAAPAPASVSFSHKDWDLVCDNTLTCRAAGYSTDDTDPAATVLLTREAGPATAISNQVMLADYDGEAGGKHPGAPLLLIDAHSLGRLLPADEGAWQMTKTQFTAFMQALRKTLKSVLRTI